MYVHRSSCKGPTARLFNRLINGLNQVIIRHLAKCIAPDKLCNGGLIMRFTPRIEIYRTSAELPVSTALVSTDDSPGKPQFMIVHRLKFARCLTTGGRGPRPKIAQNKHVAAAIYSTVR